MCRRSCMAGVESVDTIKKSMEKLMENTLLSGKTVATHKDKIQEMYDAILIERNE